MSLKKYEALAKTIETGSLTKAADLLGYTQSGMSHILNNLESELGFGVLIRNRSGVKLTAAGERIMPAIYAILEKKREIDELAAAIVGDSAGTIRVGVFSSVAVNWLPGILKAYQTDHPAVQIRMLSGDYHDVNGWLEKGEVDVGFLALPGPEGLQCIRLKEDPLVTILPVGHPLANYDAVPAELVAREPIISLLDTSSQDIYRALGDTLVKPEIRYVMKDDYAIIALVRAGLGVSIMPELLVRHNDTDVVVKQLSPPASRVIAIGISGAGNHNPAVESFIQCVERWVQENT